MLHGEHSAILLTFIKLPFVTKIFVLSIFEWPLKTGFTVVVSYKLNFACFLGRGGEVVMPPANFVCGGVYCFHVVRPCVHPSVRPSVRPSVTFCFLNILKSLCWIFIKPCKHVNICKTNTLDKKVRARGQFY